MRACRSALDKKMFSNCASLIGELAMAKCGATAIFGVQRTVNRIPVPWKLQGVLKRGTVVELPRLVSSIVLRGPRGKVSIAAATRIVVKKAVDSAVARLTANSLNLLYLSK